MRSELTTSAARFWSTCGHLRSEWIHQGNYGLSRCVPRAYHWRISLESSSSALRIFTVYKRNPKIMIESLCPRFNSCSIFGDSDSYIGRLERIIYCLWVHWIPNIQYKTLMIFQRAINSSLLFFHICDQIFISAVYIL